jgi:hypothetical protein
MVAGVVSSVALMLDGAVLLAERPERVSGAHEAAAQAVVQPDQAGNPTEREPAGQEEGREDAEREAGEASVVAVAGVFIDAGIEDESVAAAMAALAIEFATRSL